MSEPDAVSDEDNPLTRLIARIEKLEGTVHQLRAEAMHPTFYCPSRKEFQALESRVAAIKQSPARAPLPPHP